MVWKIGRKGGGVRKGRKVRKVREEVSKEVRKCIRKDEKKRGCLGCGVV